MFSRESSLPGKTQFSINHVEIIMAFYHTLGMRNLSVFKVKINLESSISPPLLLISFPSFVFKPSKILEKCGRSERVLIGCILQIKVPSHRNCIKNCLRVCPKHWDVSESLRRYRSIKKEMKQSEVFQKEWASNKKIPSDSFEP